MKGLILIVWLAATAAFSQTRVTTYITQVQEERNDTRFTLTEWLKIKERMKLMDVWLAMFSSPQESKTFRPELSLFYGVTKGKALDGVSDPGADRSADGQIGRAQLWLTNIVSSTFGIRTLNIDFGVGAQGGRTQGAMTLLPIQDSESVNDPGQGPRRWNLLNTSEERVFTGNLRLFGKNIQDSSLVFQYGNSWVDLPKGIDNSTVRFRQDAMAVELQLYLFRWLGLEGQYLVHKPSKTGDQRFSGSLATYGPYIEISLLRIYGGAYQRHWEGKDSDTPWSLKESGTFFGLKLQF